ncbi:glycoside hydrolase family 16 protein [Collybiopsis luxurians FD-317 M1]|uniref:Glycoside hydrolase family 16 protein n=1 Tax=Collybiopsis luxurians FD-317 M1 TaxID=944289 RepID=A0A0D0C5B1_9AGAR|nr:glycoside hydrolase family 16 protein [Collybiopsis luxurians FD-317 M1]
MPSLKNLRLSFVVSAWTLTVTTAQYTLSQNLSGNNFFQGFDFLENATDLSNNFGEITCFDVFGNVHYVSQSTAQSLNMSSVNADGRVILAVDNSTSGEGNSSFGRNSISSRVWPGFFTKGQGVWPTTGEIDIVEGIFFGCFYSPDRQQVMIRNVAGANRETNNRYSLHVSDVNCKQPTSIASNQTGTISTAQVFGNSGLSNCNVTGEINDGCVVTDASASNFGAPFAAQGGGVYAASWDSDGITMWFFPRNSVPDDIKTSASPDPTKWGKPSALYPASSCDPSKDFGPQLIAIDIDICGSYAGAPDVFGQTCGNVTAQCTDLIQEPSNYNDAYWEINSLRVYTK